MAVPLKLSGTGSRESPSEDIYTEKKFTHLLGSFPMDLIILRNFIGLLSFNVFTHSNEEQVLPVPLIF